MHVSRGFSDVEATVRKLSSRIRPNSRLSRSEWPVISAAQPLFYLIRLIGLAPFSFSEGDFKSSRSDVIYSSFCSAVNAYFAYVVLKRFSTIHRSSAVLDFTENTKVHHYQVFSSIISLQVVLNSSIALLNVLHAIWTRKKLIAVLNVVKNYDSKVRDLGHPRTERATKVWAWSTCLCFTFVWITVSRTGLIAFSEPWINNTTYLLNYSTASGSVIKFSSIVLLLGQRFRHLNRIAERSKGSVTIKYTTIELGVVKQLHNSLMTAGESLNSQFSWLLLLWLANLSAHSTSNLYFLINWAMETPSWAMEGLALIHCLAWWIIAFVAQLLLLHIVCHFTSAEANSMGLIVIDWKALATDRNYRVESTLHFFNRRLHFSAADCFNVDLSLLRSIAAILTTYLVLLVQFQDIDDK